MKKIFIPIIFIFIFFIFLNLNIPAIYAASASSPMGITSRLDNSSDWAGSNWNIIEKEIRLMAEAGVAWDRLFINSNFVVSSNGTINNDYLIRMDKIISLYNKYGIHAYMMIFNGSEFIGYKGEACSGAGNPINWPYNYWHSPPKNQAKWDEFVSTLVDRYKNNIKYWEISFEPNNPGCQFLLYPDRYVTFLKNTSALIRQHDPQAKIILGRLLPLGYNSYFSSLLDHGAGPYFDVVSVGGPYQCTQYDNSANAVITIKNILSNRHMTKTIWFTEVLCTSDADGNGESDDEGHELQKTFIKEIYQQTLNAGAQKVFINGLADRNNFENVAKRMNGILSHNNIDLEKKPSFLAYQQAAIDAGFPPPTNLPTTQPSINPSVNPTNDPTDANVRYAACDLCGYCPPNPAPQSWSSCQKCLYPNISSDPEMKESLIIDPETNLPPSPFPGRQYTFLGCLGKGEGGFGEEGAAGSVVQSILNIIFSASGGIAFLYLIYGSFIIVTSQANPERLNYGKRVVYGAIAGLIFTLASVFIVKFIASGILKIPGFGE